MPAVRGLEDYLRTLEIVEPRPLHELQETTIGVDVFQWLRSNNFICKEALHSALGGLPITLEQQVHQQLFEFHKWKIHPLFVFNGLKYSQNARAPFSSSRSRKYAAKRKQAWKSMENENITKAIELFSQISGYVSISAQDDLIRIFCRWNAMIPSRNKSLNAQYISRQKNARANESIAQPNYFKPIAWIRAPYYAASQMAYLESQEEMLHAVCGGCDLLMFGGEKVILNIDFANIIYEVTDLDQVLYALRVNQNPYSFIDSCLLSGFDASRTFAPLTFKHNTNTNNNNNARPSASATDQKITKRTQSRRNFSYKFSLEEVLQKGSGIEVINEYLCTFDDAASVRSFDSNMTASTIASKMSTRSMQSIGGKSTRSMQSIRSALSLHGYQQKTNQSARAASGNIDKILQHMLCVNESNSLHIADDTKTDGDGTNTSQITTHTEEKKENPKYREYKELYLVVRKRVCNAKVLSFNGETKTYRPFKWMHHTKTSDATKVDEQDEDAKEKKEDEPLEDEQDDIPSNVYRLLGVGILSTFLCSAILGGHLIDTTPLIDSEQLENAMNNMLPLRERVLHVFQHAFGTKNTVSLQRWFQPNRDKLLSYDTHWANQWVKQYQFALNVLFNEKLNSGGGALSANKPSSVSLISPLKMIGKMREKGTFNTVFVNGTTSLNKNETWSVPPIRDISQLLVAAYCGTLITLNYIQKDCELSGVAQALSKINKFEFETVLALEMLQNEDLSEGIFTLIDENGKVYQIEPHHTPHHHGGHHAKSKIMNHQIVSQRRTLRLLSRICSLLPIRPFIDGKTVWNSKLSHSLAAFNHITTTYHHGIKNCIESTITWLYCNIKKSDDDNYNKMISPTFLKELALSLKQLPPEPCSGVGVLILQFVSNFALVNWNDICHTTACDDAHKTQILKAELQTLQNKFAVFTRIHFVIQCCFQFFYQICTLVKELGDLKVLNQAVVIQFEDAYEYLRELGIWDAIYFMEITLCKNNKKPKPNNQSKASK